LRIQGIGFSIRGFGFGASDVGFRGLETWWRSRLPLMISRALVAAARAGRRAPASPAPALPGVPPPPAGVLPAVARGVVVVASGGAGEGARLGGGAGTGSWLVTCSSVASGVVTMPLSMGAAPPAFNAEAAGSVSVPLFLA
jgi:hypothetical protein